MTQEKNTIQPLDFIIIYIGGAFIAGLAAAAAAPAFSCACRTTAGVLVSGLG